MVNAVDLEFRRGERYELDIVSWIERNVETSKFKRREICLLYTSDAADDIALV